MIFRALTISVLLLLTGCDLEALLADPKVAQREADAKAIGGACRHALRSIEDCYAMNERASKAAVFAGWREMDQYMRDNKIEGIEPKAAKQESPVSVAADEVVIAGPNSKKELATDTKTKPATKPADAKGG